MGDFFEQFLNQQRMESMGNSDGNMMGFNPGNFKAPNNINNPLASYMPSIEASMVNSNSSNPVGDVYQLLSGTKGINARDADRQGFTINPLQGSANVSLGKNFNLSVNAGRDPGAQLRFAFGEKKPQTGIENTYIPGNERQFNPDQERINASVKKDMVDMRPNNASFIDTSLSPDILNQMYKLNPANVQGIPSAGRQALMNMLR